VNAAMAIKAMFGVLVGILYAIAGQAMLTGATGTPGYKPGTGVEWLITMTGAAMTAFVAAQIGVVVATPGGDLIQRLRVHLFGTTSVTSSQDRAAKLVVAVLVLDVVVLCVIGIWFVLLLADPSRISVPAGADPLKEAPEYVSLQAKAFVALAIAGATGVGVATNK